MIRRRTTVICLEGWYYLLVVGFVAVGSVLRNVNLLMVVAAIMLFAFLLSWRAAIRGLYGVSLRRKVPLAISAGEILEVRLELHNAAARHLFAQSGSRCLEIDETIRHLLPKSQLAKKTVHLLCWYLAKGGSAKLAYRARLFERGVYRIGPTRIATGFPLGLVRHIRIVDQGDRIVVFPRTGRLTPAFGHIFRQIQVGMRGDPLRQDRQTGDFHGLRDWREGDGRRMIHWRSTARRGMPVVREFEQQQHRELNLLVDLGRAEKYPDPQRCEEVIRFAATIVTDFCQRRDGILRMAVVGHEVAFGGGTIHLELRAELLTLLAVAEAQKKKKDTSPLFEKALGELWQPTERPRPTLILSPQPWEPADLAAMASDTRSGGGPLHCIDTSGETLWEFFDPAE